MRAEWNGDRDPLSALWAGRGDGLFSDFVRLETDTFLGFFRRLGAGPEEAEDLTQELFVRLYRHAPRYRPTERFLPLCFRVARNAWIDAQRRRAVRPPDAIGEGGDQDCGGDGRPLDLDGQHRDLRELAPDRAAEIGESAAEVERALKQLSDGQRAVFELGLVQELPYPEIAAVLDIPVGTVKSRMFHAVRRLRDLLGASHGDPAKGVARRDPAQRADGGGLR